MSVLTISEVSKSYRRGPEVVQAVRAASLELAAGEFVALVGPSGSGKTTLLNLVMGWEVPDAGNLWWRDGRRVTALSWSEITIAPQRLGLAPELTIRENVELPLRWSGARDSLPDDLLNDLELGDVGDRLPDEVSLGEQQRATLARALVSSPALLLADEPTGHQDGRSARRVLDALAAARDAGVCCFIATHDPEIRKEVDRIIRMEDGSLVL